MDSTDMELECDGSCETSKIVRDEDTDGKCKTINVDLDSYGREDVPNPPKIRKNVKQSMVWDHFERLKGDPNDPRAKYDNIDELPFKFVDGKEFKKFVDKLTCGNHTRFVVPSRFTVARDVLKLWNFTYMMLEAAVKFEKAFDRLEDEDASYRHDMSPNKEDWTNARMLIRFLKVFYDVILKISGSLYTTSNLVFHQITVVQNCIRLNAGSANALLVGMANNMKEKFEKYWETMKRIIYVSFMSIVLLEVGVDKDVVVLGSLEIDIYLLDANVRTKGDFDILQRWKMSSDRFEVLGHMARDILAILVSTVAFESSFSTGGRVVDSSRYSLAPKTVEALICTQNWLNSDPIHLQFQHELEEASKLEEGFWVVMENEKELEDLPDFDKLSIID
ncbi:zinc finger BED domain-containing protein RICESLEEPER 2-like [Cucumis melo var. makuwa]|uniref:Zinc finger BED domain-containing protein RICESLEEPER 2-like n=1 Tax=Cucumis melo var. makuwa TaxID=1194695 RepID=A0A5A7URL7_CUCMM|nr:zinc finger BED domain-containing protein RICESLEEPER 2-like [Cucumis melo var. makuwa]